LARTSNFADNVPWTAFIEQLKKPSVSPQGKGPLPLLVGITGHRDIPASEHERIQKHLRDIFRAFQERLPQTRICLVSPLAEGADRIAAEVVMEFSDSELIAVLPLPEELYLKDFTTENSLREYTRLKDKADELAVLPIAGGYSLDAVSAGGTARDTQYEQAGAWIVEHCHLLIALWDGRETGQKGGTGEVVSFQLNGLPANYTSLENSFYPIESGLVIHIPCNREKNTSRIQDTAIRILVKRHENSLNHNKELNDCIYMLKHLNSCNSDILLLKLYKSVGIENSKSYLPIEKYITLTNVEKYLYDLFIAMDALSLEFQQKWNNAIRVVFILAFIGICMLQIYSGWISLPFAVLYLSSMAAAWLAFFFAKRKKQWQIKYQDYRSLAEAAKIQLFLAVGGAGERIFPKYIRGVRGELDWLHYGIAYADMLPQRQAIWTDLEKQRRSDAVSSLWIDDQRVYFAGDPSKNKKGAAQKNKEKGHALEKTALAGMYLSAALVMLTFLLNTFYPQMRTFITFLSVTSSILIAGAGILGAYAKLGGFAENAKRYEKNGAIFIAAQTLLRRNRQNCDEQQIQRILAYLGNEALEENISWIRMHRDRPIELPLT
jgi:hypothetical protein